MRRRSKVALVVLFLLSLTIILAGIVAWYKVKTTTKDSLAEALSVIAIVNERYPGPTNSLTLWRNYLKTGTINGMLATLKDPYTRYLNKKEYSDLKEDINGSFYGIGVLIDPNGSYPTIVKIFPDTPGDKAGLKEGDIILSINGEDVKKISSALVSKKIRGPAGTIVTLRISRKVNNLEVEKECQITRAKIEVPLLDWRVEQTPYNYKVGYLFLYGFNENTAKYMDIALQEFAEKNVDGIILDMRLNPGGLLEQAVSVSSFFLREGVPVLHILQKNQKPITRYAEPLKIRNWPLVVLVSKNSASAAEIVAGALKDNGVATLVGETTYGKGVVQEVIPFGDTALYLTIAKYQTAGRHDINKKGVTPNIYVPFTFDKNKKDIEKEKAIQLIEDKIAQTTAKAS